MFKRKAKQTVPPVNEKSKKRERKGKLRENIESIAIAIALAFAIRYFAVEAFKIPTGSMAPTLLGEHKDVRCTNCNWFFYADRNTENAICPNCHYDMSISSYCDTCNSRIRYNWPAWLWKKGSCPKCNEKIPWENLSNRIIHGGNRILVNKFWYKFKNPQRWDVVVFVYPLYDLTCKNCYTQLPDVRWQEGLRCPQCGSARFSKKKKNYIKRLVGLPGEKLQIVNGDIYINDKIQRKPRKVQETLWFPVYDSNYPAKKTDSPIWIADSNVWTMKKEALILNNNSDTNSGVSLVTFGRKITDHNGYNRNSTTEMGDVKISFDVTPSKGSHYLKLVLEKNKDIFTAIIPMAGTNGKCQIIVSDTVREKDFQLQTDQVHRIEFSNVDRMVSLSINEKEIISFDTDDGTVPVQRPFDTSRVRFGGNLVHTHFKNIQIYRDIYYTNLFTDTWGTDQPSQLGEKDYFMLGDNSRNSNDSRVWKFVPEENIVGKAFFVFWPLDNINFIR
ncbi:MAG: S26 family signal peptidase [Candidatus Loosdrechtia sp.]|uniref:S26 family signal peptidase n=1 Tax=Candidatus Loosdrechtia sp. TaxID=3101272 RepID=UPI003A75BD08|nr:MAG: S26 family signal peptidase [Candidatus Jettenia sp. AMX2]